jgi:hypothetical protein
MASLQPHGLLMDYRIEFTNLSLLAFMGAPQGWGREQGREVYNKLLRFVESRAGANVFLVSVKGVSRVDISFASETIVELARRFRGTKGFPFVDLTDPDMIENWEAAAERKKQPLILKSNSSYRVIGLQPTQGTADALQFALSRPTCRAAEFASANPNVSISNASMKFKQLWEQGFLLRYEAVAESGGVEYIYCRIG